MTVIIFAPDDQSPMGRAILQAYFVGCTPRGRLIPMIGSYNGVTEYSYMCREDDFNDFIDAVGIVNKQESVLGVTQCNKAYATLRFRNDTGDFRATSSASKGGNVLGIGCLKNVPMHEALESDGWTYRPDTNEWYIAVRGNPDTIPPPEGWKAHSATLH